MSISRQILTISLHLPPITDEDVAKLVCERPLSPGSGGKGRTSKEARGESPGRAGARSRE